MTTERFKQINLPADIIDMKTSKIYHTITGNDGYELCILLNELHDKYIDEYALRETLQLELQRVEEENEQLRHDATILIQSNQDYRKENEQLKKQLMDCEKFRHTVFQEISKEMTQHD
jgi:FtsZ-binding cell division protein ZapB